MVAVFDGCCEWDQSILRPIRFHRTVSAAQLQRRASTVNAGGNGLQRWFLVTE